MKFSGIKIHFIKGILIEDKVTTIQFSQLRPRKSYYENEYLEKFLLQFRKLPVSSETVTFLDPYLGAFEVQYGWHVPIALHVEFTNPRVYRFDSLSVVIVVPSF